MQRKRRRNGVLYLYKNLMKMITIIILVGLFSCYAGQIDRGWQVLQDAQTSRPSDDEAGQRQAHRSYARITSERLRLIVADYEAGMSAYDLAEKYGHNRGTIMKHLATAGVRSRVAVPTDDEVAHWRKLHAQGLGFKTIARRVERNHKTVRKYLTSGA